MILQTTITLMAGGVGSGCRGENCGRKILYHGTSLPAARQIAKQGLKGRGGFVSLGSRIVADRFSEEQGSSKGRAVIKFSLPEELVKKLKQDENYPEGAWFFKGAIPKEYIKEVHLYTRDENGNEVHRIEK